MTTLAAASAAIRPTANGSSRTLRKPCTTTPCLPSPIRKPGRTDTWPYGVKRRSRRWTTACGNSKRRTAAITAGRTRTAPDGRGHITSSRRRRSAMFSARRQGSTSANVTISPTRAILRAGASPICCSTTDGTSFPRVMRNFARSSASTGRGAWRSLPMKRSSRAGTDCC